MAKRNETLLTSARILGDLYSLDFSRHDSAVSYATGSEFMQLFKTPSE
jgi:hypothetical protein